MRPLIGLIPLYDDEKESLWMLPGYMAALEQGGGLPVMLPLTDDLDELAECLRRCDGLLFTGGHDVAPALYRAAASPACGATCPLRDRMEAWLLRWALLFSKPVLGICRGIQLMNAVLGGTLYQDLPTERPGPVEHHMAPPYDRAVHTVEVLPGTPLAELLGPGSLEVNSYHHQAIRSLSPELRAMAVSSDGLIEAVYRPGHSFAMAVQWHPEFFYQKDPASRKLMEAFAAACGEAGGR